MQETYVNRSAMRSNMSEGPVWPGRESSAGPLKCLCEKNRYPEPGEGDGGRARQKVSMV